jgi:hypothetical protein
MEIRQKGYQDVYFEKYDEVISVGRPTVLVKNLVIGSLYVDVADELSCINHKTMQSCKIKFSTRGWASNSSIAGTLVDKAGVEQYQMIGSWWDEIYLKDVKTGKQELIWK